MPTPYSLNKRGERDLPRVYIPSWFKIEPSTEYGDGLLNLNLLDDPVIAGVRFIGSTNMIAREIVTLTSIRRLCELTVQPLYILSKDQVKKHGIIAQLQEYDLDDFGNTSDTPVLVSDNIEWLVDPISDSYRLYNGEAIEDLTDILKGPLTTPPSSVNSHETLVEKFSSKELFSSFENSIITRLHNRGTNTTVTTLPTLGETQSLIIINNNDDNNINEIIMGATRNEIIVGDTPPQQGSIIAYSDDSGSTLAGTNSSHILYFKNSGLKNFHFKTPHNHVIERIQKLYRAETGTINQNLSTMTDSLLTINATNENDANVVSGTEILSLVEGGH